MAWSRSEWTLTRQETYVFAAMTHFVLSVLISRISYSTLDMTRIPLST